MTSSPRIFISYRRDDVSESASRLCENLRAHFGAREVFIDRDLSDGERFRQELAQRVQGCAVLLVVIGPAWLELGRRHKDANSLDYAHMEIGIALNNSIRIIPLLVRDAKMPTQQDLRALPPGIEPLAERQARRLSLDNWADDIPKLIVVLDEILGREPRTIAPAPLVRRGLGLAAGVWAAIVRHSFLAACALVLVVAGIAYLLTRPPPLMIYSSLPKLEQQRPTPRNRGDEKPTIVVSKATADMEWAMRLALRESGYKAGNFDVEYEALDASEEGGGSAVANAERADDENIAVYIGDFNSGESQESIPILSRARIAQISPSSTRTGLTTRDDRGDVDEPIRYYPRQPGYPNGYKNFVRLIPRDTVQARALLGLMVRDGCKKAVLINDNSPYGEALANNIRALNRIPAAGRGYVRFAFSQSVGPYGHYEHLVAQARDSRRQPDCFVYAGSRNPNAVEVVEAFARALPTAQLYGTDGLAVASFYDPDAHGLDAGFARRMKIMVPPHGGKEWGEFTAKYGRDPDHEDANPDPYAVYAYVSMQLALDAIRLSDGKPERIPDLLRNSTGGPDSPLGRFSITPAGDTTNSTYGVARIQDGELTTATRAPPLRSK